MKRLIVLLFCCAFYVGTHFKPGYITTRAIATGTNTLKLDNNTVITVYNDCLSVNETYVLLLDPVNDFEVLNCVDLETWELNGYKF